MATVEAFPPREEEEDELPPPHPHPHTRDSLLQDQKDQDRRQDFLEMVSHTLRAHFHWEETPRERGGTEGRVGRLRAGSLEGWSIDAILGKEG